jgi:hypothetical protein
MKKIWALLATIFLACNTSNETPYYDFEIPFETSEGTQTSTYHEVIDYWNNLAKQYSQIHIQEVGETDSGHPLHLITYDPDSRFNFDELRAKKRILLINNGIHPGESDGIDATMMLFRDLVNGKIEPPKQTILAAIAIYNVGGSLNRNSGTRANQNGPEAYGFRGNAQNYDLNRDFIKSDTKNAQAFAEVFHMVKPDVFIDNHVSNGADYQYTLTHLFTQHNKLQGALGNYLETTIRPKLEEKLMRNDWIITPYVNVFGTTPDNGFSQFMDYPRYSSGYTTLFNTLGMMVETHMLKPYKPRVEGTYELMQQMIRLIDEEHETIAQLRNKAWKDILAQDSYPINWTVDSTQHSILNFKGYEAEYPISEITGKKRLKYNRNRPFEKEVRYNNYFVPTESVKIPKGYIVPQGWHKVVELLKLNAIEMQPLKKDSTITVASYRIADYKTRQRAYEGHYPHYNTKLTTTNQTLIFRKGDYIIPINQEGVRYLLETLEPTAPDSFFNWNFFDTILQQKEHFSAYVFEDTAATILEANPTLKAEFEAKKQSDVNFESNWYQQLNWIYQHSNHYEKAHLQYPIYRLQ